MKIGQYCQRQCCKHVELEQFWQTFASRGFVSDSWPFLYALNTIRAHGLNGNALCDITRATLVSQLQYACPVWWGYLKPVKETD